MRHRGVSNSVCQAVGVASRFRNDNNLVFVVAHPIVGPLIFIMREVVAVGKLADDMEIMVIGGTTWSHAGTNLQYSVG